MHGDQFIQHLRTESGIEELAFNESGICRLVFDDQIVVDLEWHEGE